MRDDRTTEDTIALRIPQTAIAPADPAPHGARTCTVMECHVTPTCGKLRWLWGSALVPMRPGAKRNGPICAYPYLQTA